MIPITIYAEPVQAVFDKNLNRLLRPKSFVGWKVPHRTVIHPQFHKRFHSKEPYPLGRILRRHLKWQKVHQQKCA